MQCAGFADEVSVDIDQQISALRALGWPGIEIRLVGKGRHFDDVSDVEFEAIREKLERAGIQIVAYGSQIANWSRKVSGSFEVDVAELRQIMPRMRKTETQIVRIMSYPNDGWAARDWRTEVVRRLRELSRMAEANGIILGHENCDGWAGQGPEATLACLADVGSLGILPGGPRAHRPRAHQGLRQGRLFTRWVPSGLPGPGGWPRAGHRGGSETDGL
jgi:sugar phosphate isomerase/epimerase